MPPSDEGGGLAKRGLRERYRIVKDPSILLSCVISPSVPSGQLPRQREPFLLVSFLATGRLFWYNKIPIIQNEEGEGIWI